VYQLEVTVGSIPRCGKIFGWGHARKTFPSEKRTCCAGLGWVAALGRIVPTSGEGGGGRAETESRRNAIVEGEGDHDMIDENSELPIAFKVRRRTDRKRTGSGNNARKTQGDPQDKELPKFR